MQTPIFTYQIKVRDYECDAQGIVNNANYLHYFETVRHEFFEKHGLEFFELHQQGIDLVVSNVTINYRNSLKGRDEFICTVDSIERDGYRYYFNQSVIRLKDNKLCSTSKAEIVCLKNAWPIKPTIMDEAFTPYF